MAIHRKILFGYIGQYLFNGRRLEGCALRVCVTCYYIVIRGQWLTYLLSFIDVRQWLTYLIFYVFGDINPISIRSYAVARLLYYPALLFKDSKMLYDGRVGQACFALYSAQ